VEKTSSAIVRDALQGGPFLGGGERRLCLVFSSRAATTHRNPPPLRSSLALPPPPLSSGVPPRHARSPVVGRCRQLPQGRARHGSPRGVAAHDAPHLRQARLPIYRLHRARAAPGIRKYPTMLDARSIASSNVGLGLSNTCIFP
jgi:hypothetical protein